MFALRRLKDAGRRFIAHHRRSPFVRGLHMMADFVESSWHNDGADIQLNGERFVLEALRAARFETALDVGAHVGQWTGGAAELWSNCQIHGFEVAPSTFKRLEAVRAASQHRQRIHLHPVGLSDKAGSQTMHFFPDHPDLTCDLPRYVSFASQPFEGIFTTVDQFCEERGVSHVDFLKIDVEGAEHRVLSGAQGMLRAGRISCIQFEYGAFVLDSRLMLRDFFTLLGEAFAIGKIYPNYVDFAPYDWRAEDLRFCNYLCVSRDRPELQRLLV
jgi:FkbM family methyltransferase